MSSRVFSFGVEFHGQWSCTAECLCFSFVEGKSEIRRERERRLLRELSLALRARADIKFSKFYNIDSQHARNNVFWDNFCVAREIIMIIWLEERYHNLHQKEKIYDSFCCIFSALVVSSWKAKLIYWKTGARACVCVCSFVMKGVPYLPDTIPYNSVL